MGDSDDQAEADNTDRIRDEHQDIRIRFKELWNERASGEPGEPSLAAAWQPLANLLEEQGAAPGARR